MTDLEYLAPGWFYINTEHKELPVKEIDMAIRKTYRDLIA